MKVFVAGATGAIGRPLIQQLVAAGHEVVGMTRSQSKRELVRSLGAEPAVADALDPDQVARVVAEAEPEAVIHQLTALSGSLDLRRFEQSFAPTNQLRIEGTDHLLAAARAVGARRFLAQSYAGWPLARTGGPIHGEDQPLDPDPSPPMRSGLEAIRHLEEAVTTADGMEGIVLRYGGFYGPGTSMGPGEEHYEAIRRRKFPVVGDGGGVWSFIHVEDAAAATVAALERGRRGIYHVTDDGTAPVREWLPGLAAALGAKPPRRVPVWLGRLMAGEAAVHMMTAVHGASNEKAKRELGWAPRHPSVWGAARQAVAA